jgi:hypothetical protein
MEKRDAYTALKEKVLDKILDGKKRLVMWGFTSTCVQLLAELQSMGMLDRVSGVVDADTRKQGQSVHHLTVVSPQEGSNLPLDTPVITSDEEKEEGLRQFSGVDGRVVDIVLAGSRHYAFRDSLFEQIIASAPVRSIAGGYPNMLTHIFQCLKYLVVSKCKGSVAEFGVFQGGTFAIIAKTLRSLGWQGEIYGFDLFSVVVSKRSAMDVFPVGRYSSDYEMVRRYCEPYGVKLIQGDICETHQILKGVPLMFSFFDTDYYSPTRVALEMCYEQTVKGGVIAFDHYFSEGWEDTVGERIAAKEILEGKPVFHLHGTGIFLKLE